jgi:electron transport complex protein RnfE
VLEQNPVLVGVLGLCPALAVTNSLANALVMGGATSFVVIGSSAFVSLLRKLTPHDIRISLFIIVIATFVTTVDFVLAAWMPAAHKNLGAFISLIVANCLILGRQEAFASKNSLLPSLADAVGMGVGFTLVLCAIGGIRELLGSGTLLGADVFGPHFEPWVIMVLPPGGFFALGALLLVLSWFSERRQRARGRANHRLDSNEPQGATS